MQTRSTAITNRCAWRRPLRVAAAMGVPPQKPTPNTLPPAFTLVELLVAISVLSLMMLLAARIFFDAQTGVQRGLQTSQIIAESRSIGQPLARDLREMYVFESKYGGNTPGFLAIVQKEFVAANVNDPTVKPAVLFPRPLEPSVGTDGWLAFLDYNGNGVRDSAAGYFEPAAMRSDQIAFFRDAAGLESLTPGTDGRYDSLARARHARVWYGHVSPVVDSDDDPATYENSLNPGDAGYDLSSQMVLGRQALLLIENDEATTFPDGTPGNGVPTGSNRIAPGGTNIRTALYGGLHDVYALASHSDFNVGVFDDGGVSPPTAAERGLFRTPTFDTTAPMIPSLMGTYASRVGPFDGAPNNIYAAITLQWMFTRPNQRLQARTFLEDDFAAGIFTADQIAQLHAAFAPHVADFAIEFAADWIDTDPRDLDGDNNYREADGMPDGEPDRDGAGDIIWYTAAYYANPDDAGMDVTNSSTWDPSMNPSDYDGIGNQNSIMPVTYPAPTRLPAFDGTLNTVLNNYVRDFNPVTGGVSVYGPASENVLFVWSHTGDDLATDETTNPPFGLIEGAGKHWPYLIRFRFRLMDGKGGFRTIQTNPAAAEDYSEVGRWFEQIVPVPRPTSNL